MPAISFDEMWTYRPARRKDKRQNLWVWTVVAAEPDGRRWVDFEVGDYSENTFARLYARLLDFGYLMEFRVHMAVAVDPQQSVFAVGVDPVEKLAMTLMSPATGSSLPSSWCDGVVILGGSFPWWGYTAFYYGDQA